MPQLKVFLSYHSSNNVLAGNIKSQLEKFGLDVFLAHEDIEPTEEWQDRILVELEETEVFLPILTRNFQTSKWTAQETGIALAKDAFIISVKVSIDPYGFLSRYQAFKLRRDNIPISCSKIAKLVHGNRKLQKKFIDGLTRSFAASESFEEAKIRSSLLNEFDGYNNRQVNEVLRASIDNFQIYQSFGARRNLKSFLHGYRQQADKSLLRSYKRKFS